MRTRKEKEAAISWVLDQVPEGLHAPEIQAITGVGGFPGNIYVVLGRMCERGLLRQEWHADTPTRRCVYVLADTRDASR